MITGFNTDVEHDGIVYHVQTEDKGLDTPLMLSLVYSGGAILASKRVRYDDLIASGFDEKALAQRLLRQHKLICAAIRAGRLEELKKMTERDHISRSSSEPEPLPPEPISPVQTEEQFSPPASMPLETEPKPALPTLQETRSSLPQRKSAPRSRPVAPREFASRPATPQSTLPEELHLVLVDEKIYRGGDHIVLCIRVENGADRRQVIPGADVLVKILGSTFRPLIYQTKSSADGIAAVSTELPHFRSGRAAILVRVTVGSAEVELRRIIQQG